MRLYFFLIADLSSFLLFPAKIKTIRSSVFPRNIYFLKITDILISGYFINLIQL